MCFEIKWCSNPPAFDWEFGYQTDCNRPPVFAHLCLWLLAGQKDPKNNVVPKFDRSHNLEIVIETITHGKGIVQSRLPEGVLVKSRHISTMQFGFF